MDQFDLEIENLNMKNNKNLKEIFFKSFDFYKLNFPYQVLS
jgi:hypothetical protein